MGVHFVVIKSRVQISMKYPYQFLVVASLPIPVEHLVSDVQFRPPVQRVNGGGVSGDPSRSAQAVDLEFAIVAVCWKKGENI